MSLAPLTCKRLQAIGVPELREDPDAFIEDESDDDDGSFNLIKMLFKGSEVSLHMSLSARQVVLRLGLRFGACMTMCHTLEYPICPLILTDLFVNLG